MLKKHTISFKNAFSGLVWVLKTQPNYRVHLVLSVVALLMGYVFGISYNEFLTICILIIVGLVIETLNTAIEETTDAIDTKWREDIKIAKDVSAAAMLVFAIGSLILGGVIFIPKIVSLFLVI